MKIEYQDKEYRINLNLKAKQFSVHPMMKLTQIIKIRMGLIYQIKY